MDRVGQVFYWSLFDDLWLVVASADAQQAPNIWGIPYIWGLYSLYSMKGPIWFTDTEMDSLMTRVA